jgi:hypothetical protein
MGGFALGMDAGKMKRQVLDSLVLPELVSEIALFWFFRVWRWTGKERARLQDREASADSRKIGDDGRWRVVHPGHEIQELAGDGDEGDIFDGELAAFDQAQKDVEWTLVRRKPELVVSEGGLMAVGAFIHREAF